MDLNVRKTSCRHLSEFRTRRGTDYAATTGHTFPRPIPTRQAFLDTWKDMAKALELRPPVNVDDPPTGGRSWPLHSWARYIQSRPPPVDTIDWDGPLTFIVCGDAYPCAGGSWAQLSIELFNHGKRGRTPAYLWVIGMALCSDKDMAALATLWAEILHVLGSFVSRFASFPNSSFKNEKWLKFKQNKS